MFDNEYLFYLSICLIHIKAQIEYTWVSICNIFLERLRDNGCLLYTSPQFFLFVGLAALGTFTELFCFFFKVECSNDSTNNF